MAGSLKDQLLNMGLANQKKARQVEMEQRQKKKKASKARKSGQQVTDERAEKQQAFERKQEEKKAHDRKLAEAQNQARLEKEIQAQCRQMIEQQHIQIPSDAPESYNFAFEGKVKTLRVSALLLQQLQRGQLAIAVMDDKFYLIPDKFAEKIQQREPTYVVRVEAAEVVEDDDPYADYQIPDDLMW